MEALRQRFRPRKVFGQYVTWDHKTWKPVTHPFATRKEAATFSSKFVGTTTAKEERAARLISKEAAIASVHP